MLNIVSLIEAGFKVAEVCAMNDEQLNQIVRKLNEKKVEPSRVVPRLMMAGLSFDEQRFHDIFDHAAAKISFAEVYVEIIYPIIEKLGLLWAENTLIPAQEHFVTNLLRQKIIVATEQLPIPSGKETWLLFLPEDEFHELGLLFANYLIRLSGRKTIYLGANLPLPTLEQAALPLKPDVGLFFSVRNEEPEFIDSYLKRLAKMKNPKQIFIAKKADENNSRFVRKKINVLNSVADLENALK